jgi:hypothetical protein
MPGKKKKNQDELPPRDQTPLKYGLHDPGKWVDPKCIDDMQGRIFCGVPRLVAVKSKAA